MFFLQDATPDTSSYLILGYLVILGSLLLHLASLALRRRSLERDLELLDDLAEDN